MREFGLSARQSYSNATDQELHDEVQHIKNEMPIADYRMVKGRLKSMGIHVQWKRVTASMHRVDWLGILSELDWAALCEQHTLSGAPSPVACGH